MGRKPAPQMKRPADATQVPAIYRRWEQLELSRQALTDDLKELFAEGKAFGLNAGALRVVFAEQFRSDHEGADKRSRRLAKGADAELYREALARVREGRDQSTAPRTDVGDNTNEVSAAPHTLDPVAGTTPPAGIKPRPSIPNSADPDPGVAAVQADEAEPQSVTVSSAPSAMSDSPKHIVVEPIRFTAADNARKIRPYCLHADDLNKCGGQGRKHCFSCEKAHADAEGMAA